MQVNGWIPLKLCLCQGLYRKSTLLTEALAHACPRFQGGICRHSMKDWVATIVILYSVRSRTYIEIRTGLVQIGRDRRDGLQISMCSASSDLQRQTCKTFHLCLRLHICMSSASSSIFDYHMHVCGHGIMQCWEDESQSVYVCINNSINACIELWKV